MARDVEADIIANDKTERGLRSAERNFKRTADKLKEDSFKMGGGIGDGLIKAVGAFSPRLASSLASAFSSAAPAMLAGIAVLSPALAANVAGAVVGGAGVGGVIGGVLLASRDPRVQVAGKQLGKSLLGSLESDAAVFIDPVLGAISQIEEGFNAVRGNIQSIFRDSAQYVAPLTRGMVAFTQSVVRGFDTLVAKAGPVIGAIEFGLEQLGKGFESFADSMAAVGDDGAVALKDLFYALRLTVEQLGTGLRILSEVYGFFANNFPGALQLMRQFEDTSKGSFMELDKGTRQAGQGFDILKDQMNGAAVDGADVLAQNLQDLEQAINDVYSANLKLYASETSVEAALADATKAAKENGRTLDVHSAKGRANREAITNVAGAARAYYDQLVANNGLTPATVAAGNRLRSNFVATAQKMGATSAQAQRLADEILGIPSSKKTTVSANTSAAQAKLYALQNQIDALRGKTVRISIVGSASRFQRDNADKLQFDANSSFSPSSGTSRTGGPTKIENTIENVIYLDGQPFRAMTRQATSREAWRQKVGKR